MAMIPNIVFYALAALLILSAIAVVTLRNIFYSATALISTLTVVAGFFFLVGADFLGAAQVLVYVGGIMIIMLFVIMLSQQPRDRLQRQTNDQWVAGLLIALVIVISLVRAYRVFVPGAPRAGELVPTSASLGRLLLGGMALPFEAVSLVLLAALVGAVIFGQDRKS